MGAHRVAAKRITTVATLVGVRATSWGDLQLDYLAGFAVLLHDARYLEETWLLSAPENVRVHTVKDFAMQPAVVVGIDARRMLGRRFAMVPQVRVYLGYGTGFIAWPAIGGRLYF